MQACHFTSSFTPQAFRTRCSPSAARRPVCAHKREITASVAPSSTTEAAMEKPQLPGSYQRVVGKSVAPSFREGARVTQVPLHWPGPDEAVIRVAYAGVNGGCETFRIRGEFAFVQNKDKRDFALGAEGSGTVVACGKNVKNVKVGESVTFEGGAFSEYTTAPATGCWPVREASPEAACLAISGLTAIGALEGTGRMRQGQTVLITAAAGATGHIGVQLAVLAGCTVIGTCGGPRKAAALKKLGVQHIIDYKSGDVGDALKRICPNGLDIVYEGVGGDLRKTILPFLKPDGCMLCVGYISQYPHTSHQSDEPSQAASHSQPDDGSLLAAMPPDHVLMWQAKTVEHGKQRVYGSVWPKDRELLQRLKQRLFDLYYEGKLQAWVDPAQFKGVEAVTDAMEFMLSGQALGKVVISF